MYIVVNLTALSLTTENEKTTNMLFGVLGLDCVLWVQIYTIRVLVLIVLFVAVATFFVVEPPALRNIAISDFTTL